MKYTKSFNNSDYLSRIDKVNVDTVDGIEISYVEYICTLAGIRIFLGKEDIEKVKKELFGNAVS